MILHIHDLEEPSGIPENRLQEIIPPSERATRLSPTFHGAKPPSVEIQKEKAIHRTAAFMVASGVKVKTVAEELGVAESTVSNWIRQPWFQANVNTIIQEEFSGDITAMLKNAAASALLVQVDLMQNSTSDSVRHNAAKDILDRFRGKATTFVHHTGGTISEDPRAEIKRLEDELALPNLEATK